MIKNLVFVRGQESSFKKNIVNEIMNYLNPNINCVQGIRISMSDYINNLTNKEHLKSIDKSCKNMVKRILSGSHQEKFIIIDNETLMPIHWQSYDNIGNRIMINTMFFGIDVYTPENHSDFNKIKKNLQIRYLPLFQATSYKYIRINNKSDLKTSLKIFS